jgi:hypothetical protein
MPAEQYYGNDIDIFNSVQPAEPYPILNLGNPFASVLITNLARRIKIINRLSADLSISGSACTNRHKEFQTSRSKYRTEEFLAQPEITYKFRLFSHKNG